MIILSRDLEESTQSSTWRREKTLEIHQLRGGHYLGHSVIIDGLQKPNVFLVLLSKTHCVMHTGLVLQLTPTDSKGRRY